MVAVAICTLLLGALSFGHRSVSAGLAEHRISPPIQMASRTDYGCAVDTPFQTGKLLGVVRPSFIVVPASYGIVVVSQVDVISCVKTPVSGAARIERG